MEQKETAQPSTAAGGAVRESQPAGTGTGAARSLSLAALCGSWTCENSGAAAFGQRKTLQIEEGKFSLTEREPDGRRRVIARGVVSVDQLESEKPVILLSAQRDEADGR